MAKRKSKSKNKIRSKANRISKKQPDIQLFKRPRGRPPKHKKWNEFTGQYEKNFVFPKDIVKAANERLRKLEKVSKLSNQSPIYMAMERYKESYPKTKGKIYQDNADGFGVRFIGKQKFEQLTDDEKAYYLERLKSFMLTESSLARGIKDIQKRSYEAFMDSKTGKNLKGLTFDQYQRFFKFYNDAIVPDTNDHYSYTDLTRALKYLKIDTLMRSRDIESVMKKIHDSNYNDIPAKYKAKI